MVTKTITSNAEILSRVSIKDIMDELLVRLRNNITDRRSRAQTATDPFTGDGTTTVFEFTNDLDSKSRHKIMNVTSVTVDGVLKTNYTDYVVGYRKDSPILGKIQFWNAPSNNAAIVVNYEWRYTFIYPEAPRVDLTSEAYPRVSVQLSAKPIPAAVGGKATKYEILVPIIIIDTTRNFVETLGLEIKNYFQRDSVKRSFKTFSYIQMDEVSGIEQTPDDPNDIRYGQKIVLTIPFEYEYMI